MAKNNIIVLALFLAFCSFCIIKFYPLIEQVALTQRVDTVYIPKPSLSIPAVVKKELRPAIIETYRAEIGVKEDTGKNDGKRVEEFLKAANLQKGNEWCAAFVVWVHRQHSVKVPISGWSPSWFPASNTIYDRTKSDNKTPLAGDVAGIWVNTKGRIGHIFFIDEWKDGDTKCTTVEGNYSNQVLRKFRPKAQIYKVSRWL